MKASPVSRASQGAMLALVGATYFYFLIFAEFAFLESVRVVVPVTQLRLVMAALGGGGIMGAAGMAAAFRVARARVLLAWALRTCAIGAVLAFFVRGTLSGCLVAAACGGALGAATVAVASVARAGLGDPHLGVGLGLGTGLAYAFCNIPWVFHATPAVQAGFAASAVAAASFAASFVAVDTIEARMAAGESRWDLVQWTIVLLALVWLDSAAFYIIQHSAPLRAETWERTSTLWTNAAVHVAGAMVAGAWLDRRRQERVLGVALVALGMGAAILSGGLPDWLSASAFYTAGVSFYSVALVEIPARTGRPWVAAAIFSVAGWIGSALGIGMAQDLARIPAAFVVVSVAVVTAVLLWRRRRLGTRLAAIVAVLGTGRADEIQKGREVYIAEGCLHCHSQYVRAQVPLEVMNWGPATPLAESLAAKPPLFGTRRQGPDLARVGNRRSPEWNRLHLISPQQVSPGSRMPSYAHLFASDDARGAELLAYLNSLGAGTQAERQRQIAAWRPATGEALSPPRSALLFRQLCMQCHGPDGGGDGPLAAQLSVRPPNWRTDPMSRPRPGETEVDIGRIIKFGVPGLPMAGHEYLSDAEILGLARHVRTLRRTAEAPSLPAVSP